MSVTCTAQIVIGGSMNYWSGPGVGIGPSRIMYLVENERAHWILESVVHNSENASPITWIPSRPTQILADALVMIAALVDQDPPLRELIEDRLKPEQVRALLHSPLGDLTELPDEL